MCLTAIAFVMHTWGEFPKIFPVANDLFAYLIGHVLFTGTFREKKHTASLKERGRGELHKILVEPSTSFWKTIPLVSVHVTCI